MAKKEIVKTEETSIALVKRQVNKAVEAAKALTIKTETDLTAAADLLGKVKQVGKIVAAEEKKQLVPARATVDAIRTFWSPYKTAYQEAEDIVKGKVLEYRKRATAATEAKEEKVLDKVDRGELSAEEGMERIAKIAPPATTTSAANGKIEIHKRRVAVIVDEAALPREYLVPNTVKINEAVLRQGLTVPGVKVEEREEVHTYNG